MNSDKLENYFSILDKGNYYSNRKRFEFSVNQLYRTVDSFKGKRVLDIGGGNGIFSIYTLCKGASQLVNIEPLLDGSTQTRSNEFNQMVKDMEFPDAKMLPCTFQDYDSEGSEFDIILSHASINHLDAEACINLKNDENAIKKYNDIFDKISDLLSPEGQLIIYDCSNYNVFPILKITNPFMSTIEWNKHHSPMFWYNIMKKSGFIEPEILWPAPNRLHNIGKFFLSNKFCSFFITSVFILSVKKKDW